MKNDNLFTDLTELRLTLARSSREQDLCSLIRQFQSYSSSVLDLDRSYYALSVVAHFDASHRDFSDQDATDASIARAFAFEAVVLYARATGTKSNHRRDQLPINDWLSPADMKKHLRMMELRDDAFAHFGPGKGERRPWSEQRVVYRPDARPVFLHHTANYRGADISDLSVLLKVLEAPCRALVADTEERLRTELGQAYKRSDIVRTAIDNPSEFVPQDVIDGVESGMEGHVRSPAESRPS